MGWLSSWFFSDSNQRSRNGQAMSSTHEAFSLPTSSPTLTAQPNAFNLDTLNTPDPDSATTPTFTYPPPRGEAYGYVPTSAGPRSGPSSLLPLHHDRSHSPLSSPDYPPLSRTWNRIRAWLGREYPELGDTLNYGILPQDLAQIEMEFGFSLPLAVRDSYLIVDGQEPESAAGCSEGLFFGLTILPLEDVLEEWRFWREVDDDPATGANLGLREAMQSFPPGWIRKEYSQRGWIPLIADKAGNYVGVDLSPGRGGSVGQVIVFGRDFDTKVVLWKGDGPAGWATWLASFVEELESGEGYEVGAGNDASDGSEDGVGYDSYFQDGNGRGQGEGGGESGHGGLRLTGDYRGWSTLEAWADRSLRKWYEVGAIPDSSMESTEKTEQPEDVGLGVLSNQHPASSAEISINVTADLDESTRTPSAPVNDINSSSRHHLPAISTSKPPAPLPVELPTPYDILPPSSSQSSLDEDLEAGHGVGMREIPHDQEAMLVPPRRSPQPTVVTNISAASGLSSSPASPAKPYSAGLSVLIDTSPSSPVSQIQDLLAESDPVLETAPIEPTSPLTPKALDMAAMQQEPVVAESPEPENVRGDVGGVSTDLTVRLVGGGGMAGPSDVTSLSPDDNARLDGESEADSADAASITSVRSLASTDSKSKKDGKKHERKKSGLAGLKKLGHLGGLRKKDSSTNVRESN